MSCQACAPGTEGRWPVGHDIFSGSSNASRHLGFGEVEGISPRSPSRAKPRATDLGDSAGGMVSRSTVRVLVYESVEASSGSGVEAISVAAASDAAAQQADRQAGLSESSHNCYVPYA